MSWIGLGVLGAAINTGNNLLYLLVSLWLVALPVAWAGSRLQLRKLRVELEPPHSPRAGRPLVLVVRVHNERRSLVSRSLWIQVESEGPPFPNAALERLDPGASARVALVSRAAHRGVVRVKAVRLRSEFPFGGIAFSHRFALASEFLVLPSAGPPLPVGHAAAAVPGDGAASRRSAGQEYEGLRRGRSGDDVRKTDWKATARRGTRMVRETAGEARPACRLELATRCEGEPLAARQSFERELSRLTGRAEATLARGGQVHLRVDGAAGRSYAGARGRLQLLRRLARLTPVDSQGKPLPELPPEPAAATEPAERAKAAGRSLPERVLHGSAATAVAIGTATLFAYGGFALPIAAAIGLALLLTGLREGWVARAGGPAARLWSVGAAAMLLFFFGGLLVGRSPLACALDLVAYIALHQIFNARQVHDDRRLLLVSLLQLILAAALTTEISFVLPFVGWLVVVVRGLAAATVRNAQRFAPPAARDPGPHAERAPWLAPAGAYAAALLAAATAVFFVIPHFGTGTFDPGPAGARSVSGFAETARLGDIGRIKLDRSPVMEVEVRGERVEPDELKWRGIALDRFDGRGWSREATAEEWLFADASGRFRTAGATDEGFELRGVVRRVVQEVRLRSTQPALLFAAAHPREIRTRDFRLLVRDDAGNLRLRRGPRHRLAYEVVSWIPRRDGELLAGALGPDPPKIRERYLQLPALDPRVGRLAREIVVDAPGRHAAASALERWLASEMAYSLEVDDEGRDDPLAAFLFDGMAGHCEYFATAMVVLARSAGLPARYVVGYLRGETNRFRRSFLVRQADAHSWVEVYFPGAGWVPFDPTPAGGRGGWVEQGWADLAGDLYSTLARWWDDSIIGLDLEDQIGGFRRLRDATTDLVRGLGRPSWRSFTLPVGILLVGLAALALRRLAGRPLRVGAWTGRGRRGAPVFYRRALALAARSGLSRRPGETAAELLRRARAAWSPEAARLFAEITARYERARFGPGSGADRPPPEARALLAALRRRLRRDARARAA